jgi:tetratricopeptide (TPR) repeat protein
MIDGYDLDRDLAAINRALTGDMPEAAIFYCGRALEVTSARAISSLNLDPGTQVFANLEILERLSCITRPALYLGHALRRLANDARHILRPLSRRDADFAALCLGPWLAWYMRDYFRGPQKAVADKSFGVRSPLATGTVAEALHLLNRADEEDVTDKLLALANDEVVAIPALAAMVAEVLISDGRASDAQNVLQRALVHVPQDLRLNQLYALELRRAGHAEEALTLLQTLSGKFQEDEETLGITAGALKSNWEHGRGSADVLVRAMKLYAKGFQVSRERNLYLGVNCAALELWQGESRAREHAAHIVELFAARNARLAGAGIDVAARRDYYDLVTEAEAMLLAGEGAAARELYRQAFDRFAARKGDIEGTVAQANRSIALLGGEAIS